MIAPWRPKYHVSLRTKLTQLYPLLQLGEKTRIGMSRMPTRAAVGRVGSLTVFIVYLQASFNRVRRFGEQHRRVLTRIARCKETLYLRLYTTLLYTQTPRVDIVSAMHRQRTGSYRAQALLALLRVAVRIDPGVFGVKHGRGRRIIEVLEAPEVLGSLGRLAGRVARLEDVRSSLDVLAWYHVRIVIRHVYVYLLLQVVPVSLVRRRRRRRRRPVLLALVLHRLHHPRLRRLRRMVSTIQGQRYPDDQNANSGYTAGEARYQEAIIGRLVRDAATCETSVKKKVVTRVGGLVTYFSRNNESASILEYISLDCILIV